MIDKILNIDCLEGCRGLPDKSVDCVITSPPYFQLRDYGYPEQWGLEPTYQEYLEYLWSLMDEIWRVLKDEGTVWINLGDTYSNKTQGAFDYQNTGAGKIDKNVTTKREIDFKEKCLMLIPHRFAIGAIDRGWILRNDIIWAKRNGMPESVTDRFSKKHEFFFFFVKQQKYYFDLDAVREKIISQSRSNIIQPYESKYNYENRSNAKSLSETRQAKRKLGLPEGHINGKNPGDVSDFWDIPTKPSSEKHYATYNTKLIDKPMLAGSPKGGVVLDPFAGTGTTLIRAYQLERNYIGFELSEEYYGIALKRLKESRSQYKLAL